MTRILVIEDEANIRQNIIETLELAEMQTIGAADGLVGIDLARKYFPDVIISDIMMPGLDGYGVLQELRRDSETATIPFIFLTAKTEKSAIRQGMDLGANDYLTKPFTAKELLDAVVSRLEITAATANYHEKKLDYFREGFVHRLPHELRTPLVAILGFSDMILAQHSDLKTDEIVEMVGHINQAGYRLLRLIENFLLHSQIDLMKSDSEQLQTLRRNFTAHPKVLIADQARQKAAQYTRLLDLTLELVEDVDVRISEDSLKKITEELVDNAFKFSSEGTAVRISTTITANEYLMSVCNTGRGMTPQQIAEIGAYRQFERILYEQQGMGLGLTLTKGLIELHSGSLTISSLPGQITKIVVTLKRMLLSSAD